MKTSNRMAILLIASAAIIGAHALAAWAEKPGGGGSSASFTLVRLAVPGSAAYSTEAFEFNDDAHVVGESHDGRGLE